MIVQSAWAVVKGDTIMVNTIFETRLGAIRNWLCTECALTLNAASTDADAEYLWSIFSKPAGVDAKMISMSVKP